jgi:hypothetical protein
MIGQTNAIAAVTVLAFFVGLPLLATLALSSEFQYGTFHSLLSQPISRLRIWGEKMSVTMIAVLSAALVFGYAWRYGFPQRELGSVVVGLVTVIASATYWTLVARSTIGGLSLNLMSLWVWVVLAGIFRPVTGELVPVTWTSASVMLGYAGVMLWLGGRKLAQFQVTGGVAGGDLIAGGPQLLPEALARLLRARPNGALRNLVRKELQLQRPIWPLTLLVGCGWLGLTILGNVPIRGQYQEPSTGMSVAMMLLSCLSIVIAVLAGCLSLGEERTSGTHSWQLTLPMSVRRQWLIKLGMAVSTSLLGAAALPVLVITAVGWFRGTVFITTKEPAAWFFSVFFLTLAAFWCACAVNGTWPAVAWVLPAMAAVYLANGCGLWLAEELSLNTPTLREFVVARLQLDPETFLGGPAIIAALLLMIVPAFLVAVLQSYRMFRTQPQDSTLGIGRSLLALVLVVVLCSFSVGASGLGGGAGMYRVSQWHPLREIAWATRRLHFVPANPAAPDPLQLTVDELAKTSRLSPLTQRWLRGSRITIIPSRGFASDPPGIIIHLASGLECRIGFIYLAHSVAKPTYWPPSSGCTRP